MDTVTLVKSAALLRATFCPIRIKPDEGPDPEPEDEPSRMEYTLESSEHSAEACLWSAMFSQMPGTHIESRGPFVVALLCLCACGCKQVSKQKRG